jgi:hypothetical protein
VYPEPLDAQIEQLPERELQHGTRKPARLLREAHRLSLPLARLALRCPGRARGRSLDAGAKRTIGLYFMYDVKQVDPKE